MAQSPSDDVLYGSDKLSSSDVGEDISGVDSPSDETPEEREIRMTALKEELEKVESEITMLRQVLGSKVRHASELKRQLGITPFQEFKQDLQHGIDQIKSSDSYQKTNETLHSLNEKITHTEAYQKTSAVVKTASEKTSSAISSVGQAVAKKMGDIKLNEVFTLKSAEFHTIRLCEAFFKNSQTFKSFDEKVHSTYANVKAKVTGSRSSGDIDEAFRDAHPSEPGVVTTPDEAEDGSRIKLPEDKVPL